MKKQQEYNALRIPYGQIAWYIGKVASMVLDRPICCKASHDDYDYWAVNSVNTKFSDAEIAKLVSFVKGGTVMCQRAIPIDSNFSKSLDMELCQALLRYALKLEWVAEYPDHDALWLMGRWDRMPELPPADADAIFLNGKVIHTQNLPSKVEFEKKLFDAGGTFTALADIYDQYGKQYGTDLYWHYPISNEHYSGSYLVLVQEGVLVVSYNYMDDCDHEVFSDDSVKLMSAADIGCYLRRWEQFSARLQTSLGALYYFKTRQEAEDE